MCVRYLKPEQLKELEDLVTELEVRLFRITPAQLAELPHGEASPGTTAPVVGQRGILCQGLWGFSKWDGKGRVFNARRESLGSSPFFSPHLSQGRCIVPALATFEWEHLPDGKRGRRYRFQAQDNAMLYLAGLARRSPDNTLEYTVITREALPEFRHIHDRMPLVLSPAASRQWLSSAWSPELLECTPVHLTCTAE